MVGAVGLAVDSSLGYLLKTRMGKSLDTAGLAAGRVALDANAEEVAQQFFDANFGKSNASVHGRADSSSSSTTTCRFVTLSTARDDADALHAGLRPRHDDRRRRAAVIERETTGMELALVIDNTGSMCGAAPSHADAGDAAFDLDRHPLRRRGRDRQPLGQPRALRRRRSTSATRRTGWLAAGDRVLTNLGELRPTPTAAGRAASWRRPMPCDTDDTPTVVAEAHLVLLRRDDQHGRQQLADDQAERTD